MEVKIYSVGVWNFCPTATAVSLSSLKFTPLEFETIGI